MILHIMVVMNQIRHPGSRPQNNDIDANISSIMPSEALDLFYFVYQQVTDVSIKL
jgi:hypothetical protein